MCVQWSRTFETHGTSCGALSKHGLSRALPTDRKHLHTHTRTHAHTYTTHNPVLSFGPRSRRCFSVFFWFFGFLVFWFFGFLVFLFFCFFVFWFFGFLVFWFFGFVPVCFFPVCFFF